MYKKITELYTIKESLTNISLVQIKWKGWVFKIVSFEYGCRRRVWKTNMLKKGTNIMLTESYFEDVDIFRQKIQVFTRIMV